MASMVPNYDGENKFTYRIALKKPSNRELSDHFPEVRQWIARLVKFAEAAGRCRIEWQNINHRIPGANQIPVAVWLDSLEDAHNLIGQRKTASQFAELTEQTRKEIPELLPWLIKRPIKALELAPEWSLLLAIVHWMRRNPHASACI